MKITPTLCLFIVIAGLMAHCGKPSFIQVPINAGHLSLLNDTNRTLRYHNNQGDTVLAIRTVDSMYVEANSNGKDMQILNQSIANHWRIEALNLNLSASLTAVSNSNGLSLEQDDFQLTINQQVSTTTMLSVNNNVISCENNCAFIETLDVFGTPYLEVITAAGVVTPRLYYNLNSGIFAFETLDGQMFQKAN